MAAGPPRKSDEKDEEYRVNLPQTSFFCFGGPKAHGQLKDHSTVKLVALITVPPGLDGDLLPARCSRGHSLVTVVSSTTVKLAFTPPMSAHIVLREADARDGHQRSRRSAGGIVARGLRRHAELLVAGDFEHLAVVGLIAIQSNIR